MPYNERGQTSPVGAAPAIPPAPDPHFGSASVIAGGAGPASRGALSPEHRRAGAIHQAGRAIATAAVEVARAKGLVGRSQTPATDKQVRAVSDLIADWLIFPDSRLPAAATPAEKKLAEAVREFRKLVPLVPKARVTELTEPPLDMSGAVRNLVQLFENGDLPETLYAQRLAAIAKSRVVPVDLDDLDAAGHTLADALEARSDTGQGATLVSYGEGAESKVYRDDEGNVYKLSPVASGILDIADPKETGKLTLVPNVPPYYAADGRTPFFERLEAANGTLGFAVTELVGIINDGRVIAKQTDLGNTQPGADGIATWATNHGHATLPPQVEDPQFGADANLQPLLVRVGEDLYLGLDLNPRNSRAVGPEVIPFDVVFRKVTAKEVEANSEIQEAIKAIDKFRRPVGPAPAVSEADIFKAAGK